MKLLSRGPIRLCSPHETAEPAPLLIYLDQETKWKIAPLISPGGYLFPVKRRNYTQYC